MANENLGSISCKFHDEPKAAHVRRDRKGKLYIYCDDCGITSPRAEKFQRYIEKEAVMFGETAPTPEPEPVPAPVPALEPVKNKTMEEELGL